MSTSDTLILAAPIDLQAADGDKPIAIVGVAYSGGVISPSGWGKVVVDLDGIRLPDSVPLLLDHDNTTRAVVGSVVPTVRDGRLMIAGQMLRDSATERLISAQRAGVRWQLSVGLSVITRLRPGEDDITRITASALHEVSIVPVGADANTHLHIAAKGTDMPDTTDLVAVERDRIKTIDRLCSGRWDDTTAVATLRARAIDGELTVEQLQGELLAMLRASRPQVVPAIGKGEGGFTVAHLSAALTVRAGFEEGAAKVYGERIMTESRRLHHASLADLCQAALRAEGRDIPHGRDAVIRAAISTSSLPIALGDSANKVAQMAYQMAPAAWRTFAAVKSAADFKNHTGIRGTFPGNLIELPPGGEVRHGTIGEETYSWSVDTFAKQLQIDRRAIINDDASILSDVIPSMARAAARTLSDLVATTVLANTGSFWASGNANYFEGSGAALQASSLATAIQMLRKMVDADGNLLDLQPAVLAVPPELETTARGLLESMELSRVSTSDNVPTGNVYRGIAALAVEPRLSNSGYTGYSATAWYLFSAPMNAAVVVGFLDGQQSPTVETFGLDHDINRLAMGFRVYHDFGCALGDYRASIKSKGAA